MRMSGGCFSSNKTMNIQCFFITLRAFGVMQKFRKDSPVAHEKHGRQLGKARMKPHRFVTFAGAVGNEGVRHYKTFKSPSHHDYFKAHLHK